MSSSCEEKSPVNLYVRLGSIQSSIVFVDKFFRIPLSIVDDSGDMYLLQDDLDVNVSVEFDRNVENAFEILPGSNIIRNGVGYASVRIRGDEENVLCNPFKISVFPCSQPQSVAGVKGIVSSDIFYAVKMKLIIEEENSDTYQWYNAQGGKDKCIELKIHLIDSSETPVRPEGKIPLQVTLMYEDGGRVQDQSVLSISPESILSIDNEFDAVVKLRINDVSTRHQGKKFQIKISPDPEGDNARVISSALSTPVEVKSKLLRDRPRAESGLKQREDEGQPNRKRRSQDAPPSSTHSSTESGHMGQSGQQSTSSVSAALFHSPHPGSASVISVPAAGSKGSALFTSFGPTGPTPLDVTGHPHQARRGAPTLAIPAAAAAKGKDVLAEFLAESTQHAQQNRLAAQAVGSSAQAVQATQSGLQTRQRQRAQIPPPQQHIQQHPQPLVPLQQIDTLTSAVKNLVTWSEFVKNGLMAIRWHQVGFAQHPDGSVDSKHPLFSIPNPIKIIDEVNSHYEKFVFNSLRYIEAYTNSLHQHHRAVALGQQQQRRVPVLPRGSADEHPPRFGVHSIPPAASASVPGLPPRFRVRKGGPDSASSREHRDRRDAPNAWAPSLDHSAQNEIELGAALLSRVNSSSSGSNPDSAVGFNGASLGHAGEIAGLARMISAGTNKRPKISSLNFGFYGDHHSHLEYSGGSSGSGRLSDNLMRTNSTNSSMMVSLNSPSQIPSLAASFDISKIQEPAMNRSHSLFAPPEEIWMQSQPAPPQLLVSSLKTNDHQGQQQEALKYRDVHYILSKNLSFLVQSLMLPSVSNNSSDDTEDVGLPAYDAECNLIGFCREWYDPESRKTSIAFHSTSDPAINHRLTATDMKRARSWLLKAISEDDKAVQRVDGSNWLACAESAFIHYYTFSLDAVGDSDGTR